MTTASTNTPWPNATDADFRAWGLEFHNLLLAVGLTNTADTGQIDFTTVLKPGASTYAGYKMYSFNDTNQAANPIFIKVQFGTGLTSPVPQIAVEVGIGTNGAGTLTPGFSTTGIGLRNNTATLSAVTPYVSSACYIDGCFWIAFKRHSTSAANNVQSGMAFFISRSCDASGSPDARSWRLVAGNSGAGAGPQSQVFCKTTNTLYPLNSNAAGQYCLSAYGQIPLVMVPSIDISALKHYTLVPAMTCDPFMLTVNVNEVPEDSQGVLTPIGSVARNYIMIGPAMGINLSSAASGGLHQAMVPWQ